MSAARKLDDTERDASSRELSPRELRARARAEGKAPRCSDDEVRSVAREYAIDALEVLRTSLDSGDEKVAAAAARDLAYVWSKLPQPKEDPLSTPEQLEQIRQLIRQPPDVLAKILDEEGWRRA
jgi:hypothetical protein